MPEIMDAWIEPLLGSIPDESDQVLFSEAVAAARGDAPRLSVIGAWLAVAESLKRRFDLLSVGDSEAGKVVRGVREREERQQSSDRYLVEQAHSYGMTSVVEDQALRHLLDARNVFAHPYSERPTAEDVRAALAKAVEHLLSKPLLLRHRFAAEEVERIANRVGWVGDSLAAVQGRARVVLNRVDPSVHAAILPMLLKAGEPRQTEPDFVNGPLGRRLSWFTDTLCDQLDEAAFEALDTDALIATHPVTGSLMLSHRQVFGVLKEHTRDAVLGELCAAVTASSPHLRRLLELHASGTLSPDEAARVDEGLATCPVEDLASAGASLSTYAERLVTAMSSHNWYTQNPAVDCLRAAGPAAVSTVAAGMQEELGRNVLQSADGGARSSIAMILSIGETPDPWPDDFLFGLVGECLANEAGRFRLKPSRLESALKCVSELADAERRNALLARLEATVAEGNYWGGDNLDAAAQTIESVLGAAGHQLAENVQTKESDLPF